MPLETSSNSKRQREQEASFLDVLASPPPRLIRQRPQTYSDLLVITQVFYFKVIEVPLGDAKCRAGEFGQTA